MEKIDLNDGRVVEIEYREVGEVQLSVCDKESGKKITTWRIAFCPVDCSIDLVLIFLSKKSKIVL